VSWIGFDQPKSLGPGETGAQSALPIWIDFMGKALAKTPQKPFAAPEGIVSATIDPETGKLLPEGATGITEYFYQESLPSNENPLLNLFQEMTGKEPPKAGGGI
jgi:penicillin-binding protein 1A